MSIKYDRNYVLNAQLNNRNDIQVQYPLTLEFNITRKVWSSLNSCIFRVRNLKLSSRESILHDKMDYSIQPYLRLSAGYGPAPWPQIFNGRVMQAYSFKDSGSPDFITEWQGWDFGQTVSSAFSNINLSGSTGEPVTKQQVVNQLVSDMVSTPDSLVKNTNNPSGLNIGYVSSFSGTYPRGRTLFGPTWQLLQQETQGSAFIDNGSLHVLKQYDTIGTEIQAINADTGLLAPPRRTESYLELEIMFEPSIKCGQKVSLNSQTMPVYNGTYQVLGIEHRGIISASVNGKCTTKLLLFYQIKSFNSIAKSGLPSIQEGVLG